VIEPARVGTVEFGGLDLLTAPGIVMTPRSASVALVDRTLEHIGDRPEVVVDVGTGSGAIAISIARAAPNATVWATDVSADAVALARLNAARSAVTVHLRRGHLLEPVPGAIDVVVANLPYLPASERSLHPDLGAEPDDAVFAAGDGLGPYRRLLDATVERLSPGGLFVVQLRGELLAAGADDLDLLDPVFAERAA
jgi:release factor glutamine methyltransferase